MNEEQMREAYLKTCERGFNNSQVLFCAGYSQGYKAALASQAPVKTNHIVNLNKMVEPAKAPVQEPAAYLYHDAGSLRSLLENTTSELLYSTSIVLKHNRKPACRNETPLYTEPQPNRVAELEAENERLKAQVKTEIENCDTWSNSHRVASELGLKTAWAMQAEIKALKAQVIEQEWISVDDRLPEDSCHVFVACEGGNVSASFYSADSSFFDHAHGYKLSRKFHGKFSKHFELARQYGYRITHWMPLPPPPIAALEVKP